VEEDIKRKKIREVLARLRAQGSNMEEPGDVNDMFPVQDAGVSAQMADEIDPKEQQLMALLRGKKPRK
jgi:hypothetical protein